MIRKFAAPVLLAASVTLVASCVVAPPPGAVYVRAAPPAYRVEVVGTAPGPEYIWIRGYHRWDGVAYVWVPGRWERPTHAHALWVDGEWHHNSHGYYWVEGHWR
jgi:hypothetical protein